MADDKKQENNKQNEKENIDEGSLKDTINSVSLDGIDSLIPKNKTENTQEKKKQTSTSLSGIDDITSYIQKKKNDKERISPEMLTACDGTDLLSEKDVYAIVPHKKNDHKIVYLRDHAPKDLLPDPKNRKKGTEYKKNDMKIYDVHVDYAEHPTLTGPDGKPLDVRIIDTNEDLNQQLQAIRDGKGGGTNFMSPEFSKKQTQTMPETKKPVKDTKQETTKENKKKESNKDTINKSDNTSSEDKNNKSQKKKELSLDDILPAGGVTKEKPIEKSAEELLDQPKESKKELSLDDTLPPKAIEKEKKEGSLEKQDQSDENEKMKKEPSDGINTKEKEPEKSKSSSDEKNNTQSNDSQQKIDKTSDLEVEGIEVENEKSDLTTEKQSEQAVSKQNQEVVNKKDAKDEEKQGEKIVQDIPSNTEKQEEETIEQDSNKEASTNEKIQKEQIQDTSPPKKDESLSSPQQEKEDTIELPPLDSFIPKKNTEKPIIEKEKNGQKFTPEESKAQPVGETKQETVQKSESTSNSWAEGFSAEELIGSTPKESSPSPTSEPKTEQTQEKVLQIQKENPIDVLPQKDSSQENIPLENESQTSETITSDTEQDTQDLINLDEITFEPVVQDKSFSKTVTPENDGILGNDTAKPKKSHSNIGLLALKIFFACVLVGIAIRIVSIMVGGSKNTGNMDTPQEQQEETPEEENTDVGEDNQQQPTTDTQDTDTQEDTSPNTDTPSQQPTTDTLTLPELLAKLEAQQMEARRLLNKAKLLNDREGIKFATAGLLKASKSLDEASEDPTITADTLERDARRVDLYLSQAQAIVD